MNKREKSILYGIGVGPGDPELLTLKAVRILRQCEVLILPAESREQCIAYRIAVQAVPEIDRKRILCMAFLMTRDERKMERAHDEIYQAIECELRQGKQVGFLTIGDPAVYSTYMYIHRRAQRGGWRAEMISGVPSFCAAAARLGISLGEGSEDIHIIPAAYEDGEAARGGGTSIYMKSGRKLRELAGRLEQRENVAVYGVTNCGMEDERVYRKAAGLREAEGYLTLVIAKPQR